VSSSHRGDRAPEIQPVGQPKQTVEERLREMERKGTLVRARRPRPPIRRVARRPGALERFLAERNE